MNTQRPTLTAEERKALTESENVAFFAALREGWLDEDEIETDLCKACGGDGAEPCAACDGENEGQLDLFASIRSTCTMHTDWNREIGYIGARGAPAPNLCVKCGGKGYAPVRPTNHSADKWTIAALAKIPICSARPVTVLKPRHTSVTLDIAMLAR